MFQFYSYKVYPNFGLFGVRFYTFVVLQEDNDEESRLWMELTMDSISRGVIACLASLHILTSNNMPKRTYLEDLIDRIVTFSKFQLQNTVFPTFDPVYSIHKRSKGGE